ncbi:MAG: class I SAM-dependent methyltransferase [Bacteroidales bacterium]|nr:class I SAM-dependent methyltransferase [Bacteroidales bacterium]
MKYYKFLSIHLKLLIIKILLKIKKPSKKYNHLFNSLDSKYPVISAYGYSKFDLWNRAMNRLNRILTLFPETKEGNLNIMEIGCGDGLLGKLLSDYGHNVTLIDIVDWRIDLAKSINFYNSLDTIRDKVNKFDLILSYNTLEHVADINDLLRKIYSLTHNSSKLYFEFGPLYNSAFGLHAHNIIGIPYPQFLFDLHFLEAKLKEKGLIDLGTKREELQYVNKLKYDEYMKIFTNNGFSINWINLHKEYTYLSVPIKYFKAFTNNNIKVDDLIIKSVHVVLVKN